MNANSKANRWFALFFVSAGLLMVNLLILQNGLSAYSWLLPITELSRVSIAPTLYFVVLNYTMPDRTFKASDFFHFIPFFLLLAFTLCFIFSQGNEFHSHQEVFPVAAKQWLPLALFSLLIIQMCYYLTSSLITLYRHQKSIKLINAEVTGINLKWLQNLLYVVILMQFLLYTGIFFNFNWANIYRPFMFFAGTLYLGYFIIAQKEIYPFEISELQEIDKLIIPEREKKPVPRFTDDILDSHKSKLNQIMEKEKLYLQNDITLPQLAKAIGISSHDLSYVINKGFNKTFFTLINSYRITEAKRLLLSEDHTHFNILGIAYNSGFNSKSTFNSAFKKETGFSPSEFIKRTKSGMTNMRTA